MLAGRAVLPNVSRLSTAKNWLLTISRCKDVTVEVTELRNKDGGRE